MLQTFNCPNCHAPLRYDSDKRDVTVHCDYCNSTVIVPEMLHRAAGGRRVGTTAEQTAALQEISRLIAADRKIEAIKRFRDTFHVGLREAKEVVDALERNEPLHLGTITVEAQEWQTAVLSGSAASQSAGKRIGCVVAVIVLLFVAGAAVTILLSGGLFWFGVNQVEESGQGRAAAEIERSLAQVEEAIGTAVMTLTPEPTPGFADVTLAFGGQEGIGPGFFNDTRRLAVDAAGNIYTGDYSNGRIQVFDAEGGFLRQFSAGDENLYMVAMTAGRDGVVYVADPRQILRFDGATGEALPPLPGVSNVRSLTTAPDGAIVLVSPDRLQRRDPQGNVLLDVPDPFAAIPNFRFTYGDVAVDGAGNIYVLGSEAIYQFDANGRYLNRIGSKGDGPDQFRTSPSSIAVDGQGRIYACDFDGIKVFDENGRYLDMIDFKGVAFDMWVNDQNDLLVMDRNGNQVVKYRLNP